MKRRTRLTLIRLMVTFIVNLIWPPSVTPRLTRPYSKIPVLRARWRVMMRVLSSLTVTRSSKGLTRRRRLLFLLSLWVKIIGRRRRRFVLPKIFVTRLFLFKLGLITVVVSFMGMLRPPTFGARRRLTWV